MTVLFVPGHQRFVLAHDLDCLPWTPLSWSIHRGLRDIFVAFAKSTMDRHRRQLASRLQDVVAARPEQLQARGWSGEFVRSCMGEMAASAILAGCGNSGDLVRVVTGIVAVLVWEGTERGLDETGFWREEERTGRLCASHVESGRSDSSPQAVINVQDIVALTKCFLPEWSNEFDIRCIMTCLWSYSWFDMEQLENIMSFSLFSQVSSA